MSDSIYVSPETPRLPEHYKVRKDIEGLMPGEIVFPYHGLISFDSHTDQLFINTKARLSETDCEPGSDLATSGRIAVMRVYKPGEKGVIDGYVADLRYLKSGQLSSGIHTREVSSDEDVNSVELTSHTTVPLLGAALIDIYGQTFLDGSPEVSAELDTLMSEFDEKRKVVKALPSRSKTTKPEAPVTAEQVTTSGLIVVRHSTSKVS